MNVDFWKLRTKNTKIIEINVFMTLTLGICKAFPQVLPMSYFIEITYVKVHSIWLLGHKVKFRVSLKVH